MANDLLEKVVNLLGLEIGEKFRLRDVERDIVVPDLYYFSEADGLMCIVNGEILTSPYVVNSMLKGKYEVVRLPWEPKKGDKYYFPEVVTKSVISLNWFGGSCGLALKAMGVIYRTEEEAYEHFFEDYQKLTGKKLEE